MNSYKLAKEYYIGKKSINPKFIFFCVSSFGSSIALKLEIYEDEMKPNVFMGILIF